MVNNTLEKFLTATVLDICTGNSCTGNIRIERQIAAIGKIRSAYVQFVGFEVENGIKMLSGLSQTDVDLDIGIQVRFSQVRLLSGSIDRIRSGSIVVTVFAGATYFHYFDDSTGAIETAQCIADTNGQFGNLPFDPDA